MEFYSKIELNIQFLEVKKESIIYNEKKNLRSQNSL